MLQKLSVSAKKVLTTTFSNSKKHKRMGSTSTNIKMTKLVFFEVSTNGNQTPKLKSRVVKREKPDLILI